ncbi:hypothetical protein ASD97_12635 [Streptomyces sp. Root63]|nr:hypothetical protein ASD29_17805 [Streptomyces sp. Root1295]KRA40623.1 hypothetical protein ASD97_12635 [Streptomyces sp. Root63]
MFGAFAARSSAAASTDATGGVDFAGLAPSPASGERIGGMPFTSEIRAWLSCRLAPDIPTDMGSPDRSVIRPIFEP